MDQEKRLEIIREHVLKDHRQTPVSAYLKEVVYGGIDGIITTFAVVAGFSGAALSNESTTQLSFLIVLLFGLANLLADGVSMGLGNFLSVRSEQGLFCKFWGEERTEVREHPEDEVEQTITLLVDQGFSKEDAITLASIYRKNEKYWLHFMMSYELGVSDPTDDNPILTGFATFLAFVSFGLIPLIPFAVFTSLNPSEVFIYASVGAFLALLLLGTLKWYVTRVRFWSSLFEVLLIGTAAASVAFFVGTLFTI